MINMALEKVQYINEETVISAENLNDIQDSVIALESRTINGKALSSDISLSASDVGARPDAWTPTASDVGAVPTSRTVNNKTLVSDITLSAEDIGAASADHVKKTFFTIPKNETAIINFSGTTNVMIYCRGWASNLSSVINYTGYAGGDNRQNLSVLSNGGQVSCVVLPESMGQGLAIKCTRSDTTINVCIDGELQSNTPTVTFTTEAIDGLSNAETFTRVGHTHTEYAPSGYGLGKTSNENMITSISALDALKVNCNFLYASDANPIMVGSVGIAYAYGRVDAYDGNRAKMTIVPVFPEYKSTIVRYAGEGGTWGEWEWVNPPMNIGVIYRTTERYNGKPVYACAVHAGYLSAGDNSIEHKLGEVEQPISIDVYNNGVEILTGCNLITNLTMGGYYIYMSATSAFGNIRFNVKFTLK